MSRYEETATRVSAVSVPAAPVEQRTSARASVGLWKALEANVEAGAWVWTVYEMADRRAPRGYTNTGHRDKTYGVAEISSTSALTVCRSRSFSLPTACWSSSRALIHCLRCA